MNAYLPEHTGPDAQAFEPPAIYDWQPAQPAHNSPHTAPGPLCVSPSAPYHHLPGSQRTDAPQLHYPPHPEHDYAMAQPGPFSSTDFAPAPVQRMGFQIPQGVEHPGMNYRSTSPHSASPSGGSSPWSTASFPVQEVMYHPDIEISKFNRGSRGSMSSLPLASMRTSHSLSTNGHAYTPKIGMRPHAMSLSNPGSTDEQPWNLIPYTMPFAQDGAGAAGAVPGMAGASFFLRSPTPTKRQRTNQACEKCRERKAKCNGARPSCQRCAARGHICEYAKERRMRGPNKTGRRGSHADLDDPTDTGNTPSASALDSEASETTARNDDASSSSSRPGSRRSSAELGHDGRADGSAGRRKASRARSGSGSPASDMAGLPSPPMTARERALPSGCSSAPIALPTLSNGDLSMRGPIIGRHAIEHEQRSVPGESVIRYAQSMPHIGHRYGQGHAGLPREGDLTAPWQASLAAHGVPGMSVHMRVDGADEHLPSPADYPQTIHYSLSDVSSSSTPITPDQFEYAWPASVNSPQQNTFQFGHAEKSQAMLPTLPEFDGESNSLNAWTTETHAEDHPVTMSEDGQRNTLAL